MEKTMLISKGETIHIIRRRRFEGDLRRHFAGVITEVESTMVRIEGYVYLFDSSKTQFIRKPEKRTSIYNLAAEGYIVNFLPNNLKLEDLNYQVSDKGNHIFTDNKNFSLDINEFSATR